jgi:asparagine synthetase B (glutamine-hydrolysing)
MCGIFCSLSRHNYIVPDTTTKRLLRNRGPDSIGQHQALIAAESHQEDATVRPLHTTFLSTVLSLRGATVVEQPLRDEETGSVLCWNGEAWSINGEVVKGNDSVAVFDRLLAASLCASSTETAAKAVIDLLSSIRGPYAFVFYDAGNKLLYYGRDCLGRRSLLRKSTSDDTMVLSSVCDNTSGEAWSEVEADGVYTVNLDTACMPQSSVSLRHVPHHIIGSTEELGLSGVGKSPVFQRLLITADPAFPATYSQLNR